LALIDWACIKSGKKAKRSSSVFMVKFFMVKFLWLINFVRI